jgi:hypothetical protein
MLENAILWNEPQLLNPALLDISNRPCRPNLVSPFGLPYRAQDGSYTISYDLIRDCRKKLSCIVESATVKRCPPSNMVIGSNQHGVALLDV